MVDEVADVLLGYVHTTVATIIAVVGNIANGTSRDKASFIGYKTHSISVIECETVATSRPILYLLRHGEVVIGALLLRIGLQIIVRYDLNGMRTTLVMLTCDLWVMVIGDIWNGEL